MRKVVWGGNQTSWRGLNNFFTRLGVTTEFCLGLHQCLPAGPGSVEGCNED